MDIIDIYKKAKDDITTIKEVNTEKDAAIRELIEEPEPAEDLPADRQESEPVEPEKEIGPPVTDKIGDTAEEIEKVLPADWRVYSKTELHVWLMYHKDWYYDRDEAAGKELGYDLFVGFAESPAALERGRDYPIELIVLDADIEGLYDGYVKELIKRDKYNKRFLLRTGDREKYGGTLDEMAGTFEYVEDHKFFCKADGDCLATCAEPGCYSRDYYKDIADCEELVKHACFCDNGVCVK